MRLASPYALLLLLFVPVLLYLCQQQRYRVAPAISQLDRRQGTAGRAVPKQQ